MYEKVLVALDYSPVTERLLGAAKDLAALSKAEVHFTGRPVLVVR